MTRKRSTNLFVVFTILLVILIVACFVNFNYPFSINGIYYSYTNFVSSMKLGEDIGTSMRVVYRADLPEGEAQTNYSALKTSTMESLKEIVQSEGYKDVTVSGYDDKIVMQIGGIVTDSDESTLETLLEDPQAIGFYIGEKSDSNLPFATAKNIKIVDVTTYYDSSSNENNYLVRIVFNDDVVDSIAEATADGGTLYIYLGDEVYSNISLSDGIDEGVIYISSTAFVDEATAQTYANKLKTGILALELTTLELGKVTPSYGAGAYIMVFVAMAVFVLILFTYLIIKYKQMGWLACFNLMFFITLGLFILQSLPTTHFNLAGMIGLLVGLIVAADSLTSIFERAKTHYQSGLQLHVSMKLAKKETLFKTLCLNILVFAVGFVAVFMPNMGIQSFGWVALVLPIINLFTSLALMRLFINMYLPFNSSNGKKLNFHKGGENA